ncbi:pyridoxal-5'-phosphate-dependent protein [Rhodothalassium salexigens]|uniref:threonine ammonia-lyase n=1 Tax=Rhodothalassium salexigens TaxID=1086 RepID=UPI0019131332|nr:threonine/serine dehydratase [Rhodothalassium salexigens]MBK5921524.1 pyridoxal-5'-phosphate-dependent protein [Rhodothalassium salexigens]
MTDPLAPPTPPAAPFGVDTPDLPAAVAGAVDRAAERLAGQAVVTPLLESDALNARAGGRVLVKAEVLQRSGSFKFRGAYNRLAALSADERRPGVVAFSSGNHAQGVALAARLLGVPATIVMPADAPAIKRDTTRALGAELVLYDRASESREAIAAALSAERGAVLVPSFDDPWIIAGQGTCGRELAHQAAARGAALDAAIVCASGGGLTAGTAAALVRAVPGVAVYTAEPEGFDDHARSFASGVRERADPAARSICDALLAPQPGALTFAINAQICAGGLVVSDAEVRAAMRFAFRHLKLVVEPGGAVALAALLAGRVETAGRTVAVVLSGGNVDPARFAEVLAERD